MKRNAFAFQNVWRYREAALLICYGNKAHIVFSDGILRDRYTIYVSITTRKPLLMSEHT